MTSSAVPGTVSSGSRTELMGTAGVSIDRVPARDIRMGSGNRWEPTPPSRFPVLPPFRGELGPRGSGLVVL